MATIISIEVAEGEMVAATVDSETVSHRTYNIYSLTV